MRDTMRKCPLYFGTGLRGYQLLWPWRMANCAVLSSLRISKYNTPPCKHVGPHYLMLRDSPPMCCSMSSGLTLDV